MSFLKFLYFCIQPDNCLSLVLSGKLRVEAGRDRYISNVGAWELIASDAVTSPEGVYSPDFNAVLISDSFRCLRISRELFQAFLEGTIAQPLKKAKP